MLKKYRKISGKLAEYACSSFEDYFTYDYLSVELTPSLKRL